MSTALKRELAIAGLVALVLAVAGCTTNGRSVLYVGIGTSGTL